MPAYLVATVAVHDQETYLKYTARTPALIARHGGKFLTRGNPVLTLEGIPFEDRMVILEFPTQADCEAFFKDPEYEQAAVFRRQASVAQIVVQEGAANTHNPEPHV
jgi:uncharacterized protein (DUF1330 family)